MFRMIAVVTAVLVQVGIVSAQNAQPAPSGPTTPAEAQGVQQPVVQQPPPQTPAQPATIQPSPASPLSTPAPPLAQPPVATSPASPVGTGGANAPGATAAIGVVTPPAPLLPAGSVTPAQADTAVTFLQRAAELIDKSLGNDGSKSLNESGKVTIDRATLDEIRSSIGQVLSILK